jgi:hypothetical protein
MPATIAPKAKPNSRTRHGKKACEPLKNRTRCRLCELLRNLSRPLLIQALEVRNLAAAALAQKGMGLDAILLSSTQRPVYVRADFFVAQMEGLLDRQHLFRQPDRAGRRPRKRKLAAIGAPLQVPIDGGKLVWSQAQASILVQLLRAGMLDAVEPSFGSPISLISTHKPAFPEPMSL